VSRRRISGAGALAAGATLLIGAKPPADRVAFVTCPIVRDTKTVPCWLAEYKGETYYLGIQTDVSAEFNPPSLGHQLLVEGRPDPSTPRVCGGIVVKSVKVSVMQARADDCNIMLPAEDRYDLPFESPRPPGPSGGRLAFGYAPPPPAPVPPFKSKSFEVTYDFDGTVNFQTPRFITPIVKYAREIGAGRIEITGYRGATRLEDGSLLIEDADMGSKRADQMAELLRGVSLTKATYSIVGRSKYDEGDWSRRRVTVVISP
jgi:hypothetical protein